MIGVKYKDELYAFFDRRDFIPGKFNFSGPSYEGYLVKDIFSYLKKPEKINISFREGLTNILMIDNSPLSFEVPNKFYNGLKSEESIFLERISPKGIHYLELVNLLNMDKYQNELYENLSKQNSDIPKLIKLQERSALLKN